MAHTHNNYCDKKTFLARISEVIVSFRESKDVMHCNWYKLLSRTALKYLTENGLDEHYWYACIPDVSFPEFDVHDEGWLVPDEFIKEYIDKRIK